MTFQMASTMRVLHPYGNVLAFYDGRIAGIRAHSPRPNWLDDGAFALGCCSFAVMDGNEALIYDTQMSTSHARLIRNTLSEMGVTKMRVMLSHWHGDHIAGNEVFADCEIFSNTLTAQALADNRERLETRDPPIKPVVMPTTVFDGSLDLMVGGIVVQCRHVDIHSHDGNVLLLPELEVLLAGDTLEDTVTYLVQPERIGIHLQELKRMAAWDFRRILPCHGSSETIGTGGYERSLLEATQLYLGKLLRLRGEPKLRELSLREFAVDALSTGGVTYFPPYEAVHQHNVEALLAIETDKTPHLPEAKGPPAAEVGASRR